MATISRNALFSTLGALALALATSGPAFAQETQPATMPAAGQDTSQMDAAHGDMNGMHHNMIGMHAMPATVTAADANTGIVDVTAGGMALKLHFPPPAVASLKAGDQITVHMGYSKP
jgi:uncharacterized protein involved in copper resistance